MLANCTVLQEILNINIYIIEISLYIINILKHKPINHGRCYQTNIARDWSELLSNNMNIDMNMTVQENTTTSSSFCKNNKPINDVLIRNYNKTAPPQHGKLSAP